MCMYEGAIMIIEMDIYFYVIFGKLKCFVLFVCFVL